MRLELPLIDVFGRGGSLKSCWYGDCLPSPRLPDARRPLPAGAASTSTPSSRETIGLGDVEAAFEQDARTATCCARWSAVTTPTDPRADAAVDQRRARRRHVHASTAAPGTSRTTSGWSATTTSAWSIDAPHDAGRRSSSRRRLAPGRGDPAAPTRTTTTSTVAPRRSPTRPGRRSCCTRTTGRCGTDPARTPSPTASSPTASRSPSAASTLEVLHTPGHSPGAVLLPRARARRRVHRRHPVRRRAGRDRAVVQRLPDHHRVDPRPAAHPARRPPSSSPGTATPRPSATRHRTSQEWLDRGH